MKHSRPGEFALARPTVIRAFTRDQMMTYDQATIDGTGNFLVGELERLDPTINEPLVSMTWSRDIQLREDVAITDETASFTNSTFSALGGTATSGKSWIGKDANAIQGVAIDIGKTPQALNLWGRELSWTVPELLQAQRLGRPVDDQKTAALNLKWNMDIDEQVYIGDTLLGVTGLVNNSAVTPTNVVNGASASPLWSSKTPDEILADVNTLLNAAWAASGWAVVPTELRLPPLKFGYITSKVISAAGSQSILNYLKENSLCNTVAGRPLNIQPLKWLTGRGTGSTDRMLAYTNDKKYVQFPLVPLQRTPLEYRSLYQLTTYFGRIGQVETRYAETIAYADGI